MQLNGCYLNPKFIEWAEEKWFSVSVQMNILAMKVFSKRNYELLFIQVLLVAFRKISRVKELSRFTTMWRRTDF